MKADNGLSKSRESAVLATERERGNGTQIKDGFGKPKSEDQQFQSKGEKGRDRKQTNGWLWEAAEPMVSSSKIHQVLHFLKIEVWENQRFPTTAKFWH